MLLDKDYIVMIQWGAVAGASLLAALSDVRTQRIPNRLTFPLLMAGIAWSFSVGGTRGALESVVACALVAFPFVVLWQIAGGGAGDAKLMAAIGAWLGVWNGLAALVAVVLCGAMLGLLVALRNGRLRAVLGRTYTMIYRRFPSVAWPGLFLRLTAHCDNRGEEEKLVMPYGVAIFCGVFCAAVGSFLWQ